MEKMDNKTDRYFRERLGNLQQSPPNAAWESIYAKMESRKKKRAMLIFFRIAAGMALLVSAGIGLYYTGTKDGRQSDVTTGITESLQVQNKNSQANKDAPSEKSSLPQVSIEKEKTGSFRSGAGERINKPAIRTDRVPIAVIGDTFSTDETAETEEQSVEQITIQSNDETAMYRDLLTLKAADSAGTITQSSDTLMTPEQAAAVMLAMNNSDEQEPAEKFRRWTIGSEIAPLYSNRSINSEAAYSNTVNTLNSSETGILAYAGGIRVAVHAGKRLTVQSGLYYSRYGQQINEVQTVTGTQGGPDNYNFIAASNSTGTIEGVISAKSQESLDGGVFLSADIRNGITNSELKPLVEGDVQNIQLKQYFDYFELPLILRYKVIDRKMDFSFSSGLITNFMIGNSVNLITDGDSKAIGETSDINQINYLGSFGLGMEMPLGGNFSISLEPRFRYYINSIDRSDFISVHPYSFGFFAGVNYRF